MSLTASEIRALADRQWCVLPASCASCKAPPVTMSAALKLPKKATSSPTAAKAGITLPAKRQKAHSPFCANSNVSRNKPPHLLNS